MSAGVGVDQRIVGAVAVAVEALGAGRGQHGIRLGESADLGILSLVNELFANMALRVY